MVAGWRWDGECCRVSFTWSYFKKQCYFKAFNILLTPPALFLPACVSSPSGHHRNVTAPSSAASSQCRRWSLVHTAVPDAFLCNWETDMQSACCFTHEDIPAEQCVYPCWLTLGCSRLTCPQKHPTQTQTSCHSGDVFSGVSWVRPDNAPVENQIFSLVKEATSVSSYK